MTSNIQKWFDHLPEESVGLAESLINRVASERAAGKEIYPSQENILRALDLTPPEKVKVVIVGQDPYFNPGQANGLAFSVNHGVILPPSLKNIFKEMSNDLGSMIPTSGDLSSWAEQGVLLLNTVLTVEKGKPYSHSKWGWQKFVLSVFKTCAELPQPIVFMLWGGQARAFVADLQLSDNKFVILSSHPSPLGARKGNEVVPPFIGSKPFSRCNMYLHRMGISLVRWELL